MLCRFCSKDLPKGAVFCCFCGRKQSPARASKKRGSGQGSVYKRPSGTWAAEITLGYYIKDGKMKRKMKRKCGFETKKEAVLYLDVLRNEAEPPKTKSFSQLWESYTDKWDDLSKSKQTAYKIAWNKISQAVGYRSIDSVSTDELQDLVDSSAPSYYTRRDIKTILSKMYQIAMRDDYVDKNKADFIKLPKLITQERAIFTDEEKTLLWNDFETKKEPITAQMLTMIYTGMRPGELLQVRIENINLDERYLTGGIKTEKGKRRKIVLPQRIVPVIQYLIGRSRKGQLAWWNKSEDFYNAWKDKRAALGIREELTPYCCRHTYVTDVTKLGVSPAMLQELCGHEDYDTTLIYTHLSVSDRLKEVDKLR